MAVTPTYPGVYVSETSNVPHGAIRASTNLTAFLGDFVSGPVDAAVLVGSSEEFVPPVSATQEPALTPGAGAAETSR